jgi:hypothetical protein
VITCFRSVAICSSKNDRFVIEFKNGAINPSQESSEVANESSGFSSFSSLSVSNEHLLNNRMRSSSLPSICIGACPSTDSAHSSCDALSDIDQEKRRTNSFISTRNNGLIIADIDSSQGLTTNNGNVPDHLKRNSGSADDILLQSTQNYGRSIGVVRSSYVIGAFRIDHNDQ